MTPYKLTRRSFMINGVNVYRIELTKDCKWGKKGDKGGFVQSKKNLTEDAWVGRDAWVYGNARVYGEAQVCGNVHVFGNARVYGEAQVFESAWVYGEAQVYEKAQVSGNARVCGNAHVFGNAWVCKNAWVGGDAQVCKDTKLNKEFWNTTPIQIQIDQFWVYQPDKNSLTIGCTTHTFAEWKKQKDFYIKKYEIKDATVKKLQQVLKLAMIN